MKKAGIAVAAALLLGLSAALAGCSDTQQEASAGNTVANQTAVNQTAGGQTASAGNERNTESAAGLAESGGSSGKGADSNPAAENSYLDVSRMEVAAAAVGMPQPEPEPTPEPEAVSLSFVCVGDNLIHESIINYGLAMGGDWHYMYENVAYYIQQFDVAVLNQETPLVDDPADYGGYPNFGTPYAVADATVDAGFDIFTCATNHALDQWIYGVNCTISYYDQRGLFHVGTQSKDAVDYMPYAIYEQNGIRCAVLNYTYGTNDVPIPAENPNMVHLLNDEARIREDIALAKMDSDIVLVFPHWGEEYMTTVSDAQRFWTQVFYESGADVVVGAHPHVLEPFEMISDGAGHDMLVYYSLGNFVSSQSEEPTIVGGAATFTITKQGDRCWVSDYGLDALVTHQSGSMRSQVFRLPDYDDYYCSLHWMDISMDELWGMFNAYTSW